MSHPQDILIVYKNIMQIMLNVMAAEIATITHVILGWYRNRSRQLICLNSSASKTIFGDPLETFSNGLSFECLLERVDIIATIKSSSIYTLYHM